METLQKLCDARIDAASASAHFDAVSGRVGSDGLGHDTEWAQDNAVDPDTVSERFYSFLDTARYSAAEFEAHVPAHLFEALVRAQAALDGALVAFLRDPAQIADQRRLYKKRRTDPTWSSDESSSEDSSSSSE